MAKNINKHTNASKILIAVGSFIVGLIIQPTLEHTFQNYFSSYDNLLPIILVSFSIAFLIAALIVSIYGRTILNFSITTDENINSIKNTLGLRVEFYQSNKDRDPYTIMTRLLDQVKNEVHILCHRSKITPGHRPPDLTSSYASSRKRYYKKLLSLAKQKQNNLFVSYKRIIQLDEGPTDTWKYSITNDSYFTQHCMEITEFRKTESGAVSSIRTSNVFMPNSSIVIIDRKIMLLELTIKGDDGTSKVQGDLVFYDPDGVLVPLVDQLFENINEKSLSISSVINDKRNKS